MSENVIMRSILEIRLKERQFSFFDFKGKLIDFLTTNYAGSKIKYLNNGARVDVASENLKEVLFFSIENFGFQIEGCNEFSAIKSEIEKLFKIIEEFKDYKFKNIVRIGVKSFIYCHKKGKGFEAMQTFFKDRMFKDFAFFEKISTSKVVDLGYSFNDVEINDSKASIMTGPVNENEAIEKFFGDEEIYEAAKKAGFMYIIDCYDNKVSEGLSSSQIKDIALKNVDNIEKSFSGFRDFILKEGEGEDNK